MNTRAVLNGNFSVGNNHIIYTLAYLSQTKTTDLKSWIVPLILCATLVHLPTLYYLKKKLLNHSSGNLYEFSNLIQLLMNRVGDEMSHGVNLLCFLLSKNFTFIGKTNYEKKIGRHFRWRIDQDAMAQRLSVLKFFWWDMTSSSGWLVMNRMPSDVGGWLALISQKMLFFVSVLFLTDRYYCGLSLTTIWTK